ncbi:hypothetical protein [Amycolatopsis pigmentata]|uniref:Uncharacterized protein n=1 Tax=Amycolatopsis pigmentata TaxID=450801 RepID=A0ABW5G697_9PSEU
MAVTRPAPRRAIRPTFTPWRIVVLSMIGPVTFVAMAVGIRLSPDAWTLGVELAPPPAATAPVCGP